MISNSAIELHNVNKTFEIKIRDPTSNRMFTPKTSSVNKVLDDIDLIVERGSVLGILGRNGSGKSTLLKIISRIMDPDSGSVKIDGKLASILELGMGFHPDMSGRENIYLKGEMYGFSRKQIDGRINDIIDYSGIERYIDNPVKTYSSGMVGRLAFSIMVNVDADILLVDEILSVGDAAFSSKAAEHFKQLAKAGKTILFVSHNISFLEQICTRAIWIENGKIVSDGSAKKVCSIYRNRVSESFDIVSDLAHSGVADAQYKLAMMYHDGVEVIRDDELSMLWMKRAAEQGNIMAQVKYADFLIKSGNESDVTDAINFYKSAATMGDNEARMKISALSRESCLDDDLDSVKDIFRQLAERGNPMDMYRYADLLLKTAWSDDDRKKAYDWFVMASEKGSAEAMHLTGLMLRDGKGVPRDVNKSISYLENAAELGHQKSQVMLGDLYREGMIVEKDDSKSLHWYLSAARTGSAYAQYMVATMYRDGIGTKSDEDEAKEWFTAYTHSVATQHMIWAGNALKFVNLESNKKSIDFYNMASRYHSPIADYIMGGLYSVGDNVTPNEGLARLHYERASLVWGTMKTALANQLIKSENESDIRRAIELYTDAAASGDGNAMYALSILYRDGYHVEKDLSRARQLAEHSLEYGNNRAISLIKTLPNQTRP